MMILTCLLQQVQVIKTVSLNSSRIASQAKTRCNGSHRAVLLASNNKSLSSLKLNFRLEVQEVSSQCSLDQIT